MRWFVLTAALLGLAGSGLAGSAEAQEPLARPMERSPSIMVSGDASSKVSRPARRKQVMRPRSGRSTRAQALRTRPRAIPRASTVYEAETGSINRSINQQQQQLQSEQRRQVDDSLLRQEIQRSAPSRICTPGSIGC
jgi:hypothetical protein